MDAQVPPLGPQGGVQLAVAAGVTIAAMVVVWLVGAVLTHGYVVLLPDRSEEEVDVGLVLGLLALTLTVAALLYYRPKFKGSPFVAVPALGFCALLLAFLLGLCVSSTLFELYDFSDRPIICFDGYLRVSRFYQSHGKGTDYHLALADFGPDLDLYYDDYRWNAGNSDDLPVTGKCIRVHFERSGRSLRFIQPEHVRAVPCPAGARLVKGG